MPKPAPNDLAPAGPPARAPTPADAARAFLDLWERNLAHLAVHGPAPRGRP